MENPKFVNYYIDILIGTMNDAVVRNVSLQANLKIANETIEELNERVGSLENSLKQSEDKRISSENDKIRSLENELNNYRNSYNDLNTQRMMFENTKHKLEHLETFQNQLIETTQDLEDKCAIISSKDKEIDALKEQIEDLTNPKRKRKSKTTTVNAVNTTTTQQKEVKTPVVTEVKTTVVDEVKVTTKTQPVTKESKKSTLSLRDLVKKDKNKAEQSTKVEDQIEDAEDGGSF